MTKLTPWFRSDQHPVRPGIYERQYWDGTVEREVWMEGNWYFIRGASLFRCAGGLPWRGLMQ